MPHSIHNGPDLPAFHPSLHQHILPYHDNPPPAHDPSPSINSPPLPKKKHVCQICARAFTTSGHLSRHTRIHTGERNHKCPFPGCETRCSRQDNLQQHYRIHLSPGSRRNSGSATRAAMNRATAADRPRSSRRRSKNSPLHSSPSAVPQSPPLDPPPLAPAYQSHPSNPPAPAPPSAIPEPPDTPPPLAPAYPTLPPPSAPVYSQQLPSLPGRDASSSSRSTPEPPSYHSPVSYSHPSLANPPPAYPQYDDAPTYSQDTRGSTSYPRPAEDQRWAAYGHHQQAYPPSDSDRYSPGSPAAPYPEPASPVDAYPAQASHRAHLSQPQDVSYYGQYQPRQSSNSALAAAAPGSSLVHSQPSSHRHSIAHISNPVRQHSPTGTSTQSASPAVSHPPTPAAYGGYVSSMGSYAESPPSSVSPVAPSSQLPSGLVTAYGSYESSSLASAGYTHPPSQPPSSLAQPQTQPQAYDRTLPSLSPTHARDSQPQQSVLHMSFNYAQASYHPSGPRHASPPPVLAPIQESRILRRDPTGTSDTGMRYASPPQVMHSQTQAQAQPPPMQSLASVSRSSGHAFSYPLSSQHPHSHMHSPTAYPQAPGPSAYAAGSTSGSASAAPQAPPGHAHTHAHSGGNPSAVASSSSAPYYYQHAYASPVHPHREASPEPVDGVNGAVPEQYLELHQPQPQRLVTGHGQSHGHAHGHAHASAGHQYLQTGAVLNASGGGGGGSGHPGQTHAGATWRTDDYRGRGGLGGLVQ